MFIECEIPVSKRGLVMMDNASWNSKYTRDHYLPNNPRGTCCIDPFHRGGRVVYNFLGDCDSLSTCRSDAHMVAN